MDEFLFTSIFNEMKDRLEIQVEEDIVNAINELNGKDLQEELEYIRKDYIFHSNKLGKISNLIKNPELAKRFFKLKLLVDEKVIKPKLQIKVIATGAVVLSELEDKTRDLDTSLLYSLSYGMIAVPECDYPIHGALLANKKLLESIKEKIPEGVDQGNVFDEILDYSDSFMYEDMPVDEYNHAVSDSLGIIENYKVINNPHK